MPLHRWHRHLPTPSPPHQPLLPPISIRARRFSAPHLPISVRARRFPRPCLSPLFPLHPHLSPLNHLRLRPHLHHLSRDESRKLLCSISLRIGSLKRRHSHPHLRQRLLCRHCPTATLHPPWLPPREHPRPPKTPSPHPSLPHLPPMTTLPPPPHHLPPPPSPPSVSVQGGFPALALLPPLPSFLPLLPSPPSTLHSFLILNS